MLRVFFKSAFFKSAAHVQRHLEYLDKQGPLFDGTREVSITKAKEAALQYPAAIKWWFVYSLTREDQQRLQIDRDYWQQLMEAQKASWAKAYNIPPDRLHICASFHDVAHHPHIHVVLHGETASDGYIVHRDGQDLGQAFRRCRETVKSGITNEVYRSDTQHLKEEKSTQRQTMNAQLEKLLLEIGRTSHPVPEEVQQKLAALGHRLEQLPGKHQYGYLPADMKVQVDDLLAALVAADRPLGQLYDAYRQTQKALVEYEYVGKKDTLARKTAEWEQAFFHPPKGGDTRRHNLIIQAAEAYAGVAALPQPMPPDDGSSSQTSAGLFLPPDPSGTDEPKAPARAEIERNRKKSELKRQILRELERELSGVLPLPVAAALQSAAPKDELLRQTEETHRLALSAESAVLQVFPALAEKLDELAKLEDQPYREVLERADWLHRRILQYSRCLCVEGNMIDFAAVKALRAKNADLLDLIRFVRNETEQLLDTRPELRPPPASELNGVVERLADLCTQAPQVAAALAVLADGNDAGWPRKVAASVVREALLEYLPPEERQQETEPPIQPLPPEMRALMNSVRAKLERRIEKNTAFRAAFGQKLLEISSRLNPTAEYRYNTLPSDCAAQVDSVVATLLQQPQVCRLLQKARCTQPDMSVLREWVTEYACAATQEQPVDPTIPQKRRARYKFLCAFDKSVCCMLNNPKVREGCLEMAEKCLPTVPEQAKREEGEKTERLSYWKLDKEARTALDAWTASLADIDPALAAAVGETTATFGNSDWFSAQLEKGRLQNIVLERLDEWSKAPEKPIEPKYVDRYKPKTLDAAARNLLYFIAATLRDDVTHAQSRLPCHRPAKKFRRKRIHHSTLEERAQDARNY